MSETTPESPNADGFEVTDAAHFVVTITGDAEVTKAADIAAAREAEEAEKENDQ